MAARLNPMNAKTRDEMIEFIEAVEQLTASVLTTIGLAGASDIIGKCDRLKHSLKKDETIIG